MISKNTLLTAVLLTAIIASVITAFAVVAMIDKGPEGSRGPAGAAGPEGQKGERGPRGRTNRDVSAGALAKAIKADPSSFTQAADEATGGVGLDSGTDDGTDDFENGDDTDSSTDTDIQDLRDDIQTLCDAFRNSGTSSGSDDLPC